MTETALFTSSVVEEANQRSQLLDQCRQLAENRSILSALDLQLKAHGFAGSTHIPQLVFLAAYTRIFDNPVSLVIKGPSGSGKSFALQSGLNYISESAYERFSGMSDHALLYSGLDLKHRLLVIGEAAGLAEGKGRAFIRQLLTEGEIRYMT